MKNPNNDFDSMIYNPNNLVPEYALGKRSSLYARPANGLKYEDFARDLDKTCKRDVTTTTKLNLDSAHLNGIFSTPPSSYNHSYKDLLQLISSSRFMNSYLLTPSTHHLKGKLYVNSSLVMNLKHINVSLSLTKMLLNKKMLDVLAMEYLANNQPNAPIILIIASIGGKLPLVYVRIRDSKTPIEIEDLIATYSKTFKQQNEYRIYHSSKLYEENKKKGTKLIGLADFTLCHLV